MRLLSIWLVLAVLAGGCATKRKAGIGIGVGAGMMIAGIGIAAAAPDGGRDTPGSGQILGLGAFAGGGLVIGVSAISLVVLLLGGPVSRVLPDDPPAKSSNPENRRCVPVAPDSSTWTCGPGYRCTDDFESCEPADGLPPLRQR